MNRYTLTKTDEIKRGAHAAFIDSDYNASFSYRPEFLSNDYRQGKKVLSSIEAELSKNNFSTKVVVVQKNMEVIL